MQYKDSKSLRIKYLRLLEKFVKSSSNTLKLENFNYSQFEKKSNKAYSKLLDLGEIPTDSSYINSLKNYVDTTIRILKKENLSEKEKRAVLLKESNLIEKIKNKKSTKKQKHKKKDYSSDY